MLKFIKIIICGVLLSGCATTPIVIQKVDKDAALVAYPAHKEYGYPKYEKLYYVEDNKLNNYADGDEIKGYSIEKTNDMTYSYINLAGYQHTVSYGQLIKN
ncbi:MAG: hypothetical protein LBH33_03980 [Endomicrobium sp.]|jgi:hypothetical protein|nr:hypothetical protein [Endomicrobium sp.]